MYSLRVLTPAELSKVAGGDGPPPTVASLGLNVDQLDMTTGNTAPATQAQIDQVNEALAYLSLSPTADGALQAFAGHDLHLVNSAYEDSTVSLSGQPDTAAWSPTGGLLIGNDFQSAALGLIHEIAHIVEPNGLAYGTDGPDKNYAPNEGEYVATQFETQVANELGEPTRDTYYAWDNVVQSTDTTDHGDFLSDFYYGNTELDPSYQPTNPDDGTYANDYLNEMMAAFPSSFGYNPDVGDPSSDAQYWSAFDSSYGTDLATTYFDDYYYTDYGYYWDQNGFYSNDVGTWYNSNSDTYYYANYNEWVDYSTYYYYSYGGYGC